MGGFITIDSVAYNAKNETECTLMLGYGSTTDGNGYFSTPGPERIYIPEPFILSLKTYKVIEITQYSLRNNQNLVYLYIASTVEIIEYRAIDLCANHIKRNRMTQNQLVICRFTYSD